MCWVGLAAWAVRRGVHAPIAFLLAAAVMAFSAATFAELGPRMPVAASESAYIEAAFRRPGHGLGNRSAQCRDLGDICRDDCRLGAAGYVGVFLPQPLSPVLVMGIVLLLEQLPRVRHSMP